MCLNTFPAIVGSGTRGLLLGLGLTRRSREVRGWCGQVWMRGVDHMLCREPTGVKVLREVPPIIRFVLEGDARHPASIAKLESEVCGNSSG